MSNNNSRPQTQKNSSIDPSSHQSAYHASWWLDFWSTSGRKTENQDSLLIINCIMNDDWVGPVPLLVLLADGVSACQYPKQASKLAVQTIAEAVVSNLPDIIEQSKNPSNTVLSGAGLLNDEHIAAMLKIAVNKANDALYFSQSYERVAPLLSTISGVLCIHDKVHLFHTGDSRIYRLGVSDLTVLSRDHRINRGQDKGALSAALGADTNAHLQQTVFTLNQNEYLAIMTDGVYEFIEPPILQNEFSEFFIDLESTISSGQINYNDATFYRYIHDLHLSKQLCQLALANGSNDNLSVVILGLLTPSVMLSTATTDIKPVTSNPNKNRQSMYKPSTHKTSEPIINLNDKKSEVNITDDSQKNTDQINTTSELTNAPSYKLPIGFEVGEYIDGFEVKDIIARTARSEVYMVVDKEGHKYALKSPSLSTVDDGDYIKLFLKERKIGLSLSKNRRAGESSFNQINPNRPVIDNIYTNDKYNQTNSKSAIHNSGVLRYYPVPASSQYLYHLTEFIEGENLRKFIERNAPCDVWQTHDLLTKISMAVGVMHRNYLLHQDIKPENILLTKSGAVKLIDFGSSSSSILKDSRRPPVGDLHYAAPEYYTEDPKGIHSDLFSIAVIGYELLTGELPFTTKALMSPNNSLSLSTDLLKINEVPSTSQQALLRALHRNINARHPAIGDFLQDFNPDKNASLADPKPLIKRNPLIVWYGICILQSIIIIFLVINIYVFS